MSHLFKRFRRDIIGLSWLSIGIFLGIALYSFHPTDPSLNSIGKTLAVQNYCGYIGSFLADLLYQVLGLGAWILILAAVRKGVASFRGITGKKGRLAWVWMTLLLVTGSSLLALYWPTTRFFAQQIPIGGLIGQTVSKGMLGAFNYAGVQIVLWTIFIGLVVFYTEKSVAELVETPVAMARGFLGWLGQWINFNKISGWFSAMRQSAADFLEAAEASPAPQTASGPALEAKKHRFFPIPQSERQRAAALEATDAPEEIIEETTEEIEETDVENTAVAPSGKKRKVQLKKKIQRRIENWELPKISLLDDPPYGRKRVDDREIREKADILLNKLQQFGVNGDVVGAKPGPAVTMFEMKPNADVKISKITELADDLSLALSAESVRIIAPIPGRDVVGIETSNAARETVYLKDILANDDFWDESIYLPLAMGCEADGSQRVKDLRRMPHLLVAGTTGSGKSVFIVSLLTGLLFRHSPKTLRMILIDPKQVDLAAFNEIPHLLMPPVREPKKAISALRWAIKEMDKRYRSMRKFSARDLEAFNRKVEKLSSQEFAEHEAANSPDDDAKNILNTYYYTPQPYIVIVCEEFGDLMAVDKANVEQAVVRLAQMARACGIHLILAMQSPRKDVVTGLIKTNIPGRVSFKVNSKMDSRIILDESGGERLLSRGDMLFVSPGTSKPVRHHGPWVTDKEIESVSQFWTDQAEPEYDPLAMRALEGSGSPDGFDGVDPAGLGEEEFDERYDEVLSFVSTLKEVSASLLQRKFRLGYPRAARLIEIFEAEGVVGPANGSKPRQVLVNELK